MIRHAAFLALLLAPPADAAGYCRPTLDGKDRIERSGACPSGYFVRGACCEAFQAATQKAVPKANGAACPAGTVATLSGCIAVK